MGIRFYTVVWGIDLETGKAEITTEASHSRRYLADQIRAGKIAGGRTHYIKIQEIETPMIDMSFIRRVFTGIAKKKEIEAGWDQLTYILQMVDHFAARVTSETGEVREA